MTEMSVSAIDERLFAAVSPGLQALAGRGRVLTVPKNGLIAQEGEPGDSMFVLLRGKVRMFSSGRGGRELTYETVEHGDFFAEACLDGGPRPASAVALEPSVCVVVSRDTVEAEAAREPGLAMELLTRMTRRLRHVTQTARSIALMDVYGRVVRMLEGEQGPGQPERPVTLQQITHLQIACRVGASREMVSRLLKDLEKGGYIELGNRRITLRRKLPARW
ncbi:MULTISPECIES: Crp/Fnr family transcriptional regulator [Ramlibacter]|uniref:Crp/Fnr family transcriptional regulator n=1 Tax=Ramlibacter aquaticus TaxID=2780094 RepID=A0ABR9SJG0_9BURK|nr:MULTISPECIES: Crp/Fnr family transcriptional regulator [Ramlibacter]MBE7942395.1 Crp/Fnr family transcriptional regulator [Ramlibacter aquaticus]